MNRQVRHVGYVLVLLFVVLFVQLNYLQVVKADKLADDPKNNRKTVRYYSSPRGIIQSADGAILARSVPSDDEYKYLRTYPEGELFGHITGHLSFTYGMDGIERQYDEELRGKTRTLDQVRDLLTDRNTAGNVTLTITKTLQQVAKEQLGDRRGAVVALNPQDGSILAMYSNPSYDPNILASHDFKQVDKDWPALNKAADKPLLPRAYRESYPPGSTFKVVTAAAAYDQMPSLVTKSYPRVSVLTLPNTQRRLYNFGGGTCGGELPDMLRVSCNTGFSLMGIDMGGENLVKEAKNFGFTSRPPLDLPATAISRIPEPNYFVNRNAFLAYSSIGQDNVSATPLQMALIAAGIANKGSIMTPHLLKEVRDPEGNVTHSYTPKEWRRATSENTAAEMAKAMQMVVDNGSGVAAKIKDVSVAGKTGTAQTDGTSIHTWFIAYAPVEQPRIAVAVILENQPVRSEITGGRLAAPIARELITTELGIHDPAQRQPLDTTQETSDEPN